MIISCFKGAAKICKYAVYTKTGEHIFEIPISNSKQLHFSCIFASAVIKIDEVLCYVIN